MKDNRLDSNPNGAAEIGARVGIGGSVEDSGLEATVGGGLGDGETTAAS